MKTCSKCATTKPHSEFYKHPKASDGLQSRCKACTKEAALASYAKRRGPVTPRLAQAPTPPCTPEERSANASAAARARWATMTREDRRSAALDLLRARWGEDTQHREPVEYEADYCAHCGTPLRRRRAGTEGLRYCGASDCRLERNRRRMTRYNHERSARLREAEWESFDPREVYDRDGWTCGLCHEPIDPALRRPDLRCVSLDHIVPVSKGGAHTRANTQAAHLICNIRKGNRD